MTGNENAEKTHNFFEQENSSHRHHSQAAGGNWPVLNNHPWAGIQRQNGMPLTSNSRNHTSEHLDSEQGNGTQSSQMPYGTQLSLKQEFFRSQPRSQQLNLNGFVDVSQGLQGKAPGYSSAHTRSSQGSEVSGDAVNVGFLGGQQQTVRSQHPGISRPHPRQQKQGFNDMQSWRQHIIQQQLQGIQGQEQLLPLDLGGRQQNSRRQQSDVARHASIGQSPPLLRGMPINDASNNVFLAGNMNWQQHNGPPMHSFSNGLMFSDDQGQTMQPMAFVPPHADQSLYGTPVSSARYSSNHYPQSQGLSHDRTDVMNNTGGNRAENASIHPTGFNYFRKDQGVVLEQGCVQDGNSAASQGFQGKGFVRNAPVQGLNSGFTLGNFQRVNHIPRSVQVQEERGNWSGDLQESEVTGVGPSLGVANLDPTEEKLLFGTGNDANWDRSFEENPMQNDHFSAFPSIQSGSWSALMLDALEASSSDTGLHEEWGGLSLHKTELSAGNHSAVLDNNGKQQTTWDSGNLQSGSFLTSRSFSLFNDADANPNPPLDPNLQLSTTKFAQGQNERVSDDISHKSSQPSSKEANVRKLDHNHRQNHILGDSLQTQTPFDSVSNGVWAGQMYGQSVRQSADPEFNLQNVQQVWDHQQKMPAESNGWNMNTPLAPNEDYTSKAPDNDDPKLHAQRDDIEGTTLMGRDHDDSMRKVGGNQAAIPFPSSAGRHELSKSDIGSPKLRSDNSHVGNFAAVMTSNTLKLNKDINQQVSRQHQLDYGKHVAIGSMNYKGDEDVARHQSQLSMDSQAKDSSMYSADKNEGPVEAFDHKQESNHPSDVRNASYMSNHSHPRQQIDSETSAKENFLLAGNGSSPLVSSSKKSVSQSGRKFSGPRRLQYHPMGKLEMDADPVGSHNHASRSQDPCRLVVRGLTNQEPGYVGESQFASHAVSCGGVDWGNLKNMQRNGNAAKEIQSRSTSPSHDSAVSSFDVSTAHISQNKRFGQTSHNMLELLHKVDQSRNNSNVAQSSVSDHHTPSEIPEAATFDGPASLQHDHYSAMQGFSLKLAPPSRMQPVVHHDIPLRTFLQTANDVGVRDKDSPWSSPTTSVLSPPAEDLDNRPRTSGQTNKPATYLGNSLTVTASNLPHARNQSTAQQQQQQQQQQQHQSTGSAPMDLSANLYFKSQVDVDAHVKHASSLRQTHDFHEGAVSDQSARRISPFRISPSVDTGASVASQLHLFNTGPSQPVNASSHLSNLAQKFPIVETKPAAQPSATSSMSQQGGFSTMLHNVWKSVSAQQLQKIIPSLSPLPSSTDTNSWVPQNKDDESHMRGGSAPSEIGTCSINSQQLIYGEEYPVKVNYSQHVPREKIADAAKKTGGASPGLEQRPKRSSAGNSAVSVSSLDLHQQDLDREKHAQDSSLDSQKEHVPVPNVAPTNSDIGAYGQTLRSPDFHKQNYSLLQQVQAMKGADSDPNKRVEKRHKGADFGADGPKMDWAARQRFIYEQKMVFGELGATSEHTSFPSDVKMLSFSSRDNEDKTVGTSSRLISREKPGEDLQISRQHDLQSHNHSLSKVSALTTMMGSKRPQINFQIAPSSNEQYGTYKNGQIISTYDGLGNSQRSTKTTAQHYFFPKASENLDSNIVVEQRDDVTLVASLRQSTLSTAIVANEHSSSSHCLPLHAIDNDVLLLPKKRKTATSELLPWHKELTQGSRRLRSIRMVELDWAQAANSLVEKVEDEYEMIEDGSSVSQRRRKLILTTQLIQQLFPPIPAAFLTADATTSYESAVYHVAKLALGDTCSHISCLESDSFAHSDGGNTKSKMPKTSEKVRDHFLSKAMEVFIGRSRKLESDLLRLERIPSISDVWVECHDLDRCSVINRFAKFHGRAQTDRVQGSSSSKTAPHPQKHVTVVTMIGNLPSGVSCLSL